MRERGVLGRGGKERKCGDKKRKGRETIEGKKQVRCLEYGREEEEEEEENEDDQGGKQQAEMLYTEYRSASYSSCSD